jgi:glutaredoxin
MSVSPAPPGPLVTVYGADWCEDTHRSRRLLRRLSVPHRYRNVDEDLDALDRATELGHGVRRTPVVEIDGTALVEPSNALLMSTLVSRTLLTADEAADRLSVQNVGDMERVLRVSAGLMLYAAGRSAPFALRAPLGLLGAGLMLTGAAGWCPIYNSRHVSSLGGPGDRPGEAERTAWLRPLASARD